MFGAFGEASAATHNLINHLATFRVQVAGPQRGRKGQFRAEKAEVGLVTSQPSFTVPCRWLPLRHKLSLSWAGWRYWAKVQQLLLGDRPSPSNRSGGGGTFSGHIPSVYARVGPCSDADSSSFSNYISNGLCCQP